MSDDVKVDERPAVCVCNVRPEGNTKLDDVIQRWLEKHLKFFCLRTRKTWRAQRNEVEAAMGGKTRMSHVLNLIVCLQSHFWSYGSVDDLLSACPHSTTTSFLPFRKSAAMSTESLNTQRSRTLLIPAAFRWSMSILLQPKLFRFPVKKFKVHGFTEGFHMQTDNWAEARLWHCSQTSSPLWARCAPERHSSLIINMSSLGRCEVQLWLIIKAFPRHH